MPAVIAVWLLIMLVGIGGTAFASGRAVTSAIGIAEHMKIPPAVVGLTVMAIGTDLPEIANSIVASATDHGDVNLGDSIGSVLTQVTLTLGLLGLGRGTITTNRNFVIAVGTTTVFSVVVVRLLVDDGQFSHVDGLILIGLWLAGTALLGQGELRQRPKLSDPGGRLRRRVVSTIGWLALVGVLAVAIVESFLRIAETLGIPEFVGSFAALSIGTSLPELFVDWTAIRRGASSMAIGDIFGSSFVDATLSVGIGPAIFSSSVSSDVHAGTTLVAVGVLLATVVVARSRRYDWRMAVPLLAIYGAVQVGAASLA